MLLQLIALLLMLSKVLDEPLDEHTGLAGGVGGVGAPSLVIHMLRFWSQVRLVRPSSTLGDVPVLTPSLEAISIIEAVLLHHPVFAK